MIDELTKNRIISIGKILDHVRLHTLYLSTSQPWTPSTSKSTLLGLGRTHAGLSSNLRLTGKGRYESPTEETTTVSTFYR